MNKIDLYFKSLIGLLKKKLIKNFESPYFKDDVIKTTLIFTGLIFFIVWGLAFFYFKITNYMVPIRYNSFFGVTELGSWYDLYRLPIYFTIILIINLILAKALYKKEKLISYILTATTIFIGILVMLLIFNFGRLIGE
jgi:hypothetical protein